jgi:hypothetical protein
MIINKKDSDKTVAIRCLNDVGDILVGMRYFEKN